jgi:phosphohistidine phosphatase
MRAPNARFSAGAGWQERVRRECASAVATAHRHMWTCGRCWAVVLVGADQVRMGLLVVLGQHDAGLPGSVCDGPPTVRAAHEEQLGHRDRMAGGGGVAHRLHPASRPSLAPRMAAIRRPQDGERAASRTDGAVADRLARVTTRQLVVIRHAKAGEGAVDRDRPLAERGVAEAPAVGRWLAQRQIAPDRVVVSPARRARQTWELAAAELGPAAEPVLDDRIYDDTVEDLLEIVRETPQEVTTLAIVGHNPGIQDLAIALDDGRGDEIGRTELRIKYRTGGVAVFDVSDSWADVGSATLTSFAAPR